MNPRQLELRQLMIFSFLLSQLTGPAAHAKADRPKSRGRTLAVESLETREMLSVAGLVDVGTQPSGALDDKIVYIHGGHGRVYDGNWGYQRPLLLDMIEDLGNEDQMSLFADSLWNAGATVVPLRPVGHQLNEAVLDNDDAGVSFSGSWGNGGLSTYFGDAGDVRYRFATTSVTETATAVYQPNLPEEGFYPVYTWAPAGTDRATDQLYRIHHTGGATEVTVDHSRVGNGLVYLGTFHFDAGTDGFVEISNKSNEAGKVVVADMIRFGNGVGDISRNGSISGVSRENEAGLYWVEWHVDRAVLPGPNWVAFPNILDDLGNPVAPETAVVGWHRFQVVLDGTNATFTLDLGSTGIINSTIVAAAAFHANGVDEIRLGGPSNLSSPGGGGFFDNVSLSQGVEIPEPTSALLVVMGAMAFVARRK